MTNEVNEDLSFDYDENATIDDEDSILSGESGKRNKNIPDIDLYKLLTKRRKCIHFCFRKIIMISFIPTLIYNVFWIIIFKRNNLQNLVNFDFNDFKNYILITCYIALFKGVFILFFPQIFCTFERNINDFSYTCVFLKSLTSFIISLYSTNRMEKNFILDKNFKIIDDSKYDDNELSYWINLYYKFECFYIKGFVSFFLIILTVILLKIAKELLKAIGYSIK